MISSSQLLKDSLIDFLQKEFFSLENFIENTKDHQRILIDANRSLSDLLIKLERDVNIRLENNNKRNDILFNKTQHEAELNNNYAKLIEDIFEISEN